MKKLNKFFAVLVALAMMATLCVMSAFAADTAPGKDTDAEGKQSADAIVGKYFQLAKGVNDPGATFTYSFDNLASDTHAANDAYDTEYVFDTATMTAVNTENSNDKAGKVALKDVFKQAATIPDPENPDQTIPNPNAGKLIFSEPGEYVFELTETGALKTPATGAVDEKLTDDVNGAQKFIVRVYVTYGANDELVISNATIADAQGNKLDPTEDPTDDTGDDAFKPGDPKGGNFVNKYEKKADIDPNDLTKDNAALNINKTVQAPAGYVKDSQEYPFTITLTKPANATDAFATIEAYIIDKDGHKAANPTTLVWGANENVKLKAGDALCFSELPYGTTYTVEETLDETVPNAANYDVSYTNSDATDETAGSGLLKEADADKVSVLNKIDESDVTPTGILMNNLPYIVLALVAIGGLVAYVVVRRRQNDEA